jgi:transcriptional regulator with XRE-family HTH domain
MTQALTEKITTLCRKKGVSVNQMALEAGVNKSFVDNLKKGSFPSADKLLLVARYFNVSVDYLLGNDTPALRSSFALTADEQQVLDAYRSHPELHAVIRKLLDMPEPQSEDGVAS